MRPPAERGPQPGWLSAARYDARMGRDLRGPYRFVFVDIGETLVRLDPPFEVVAIQEADRLGAAVAVDVMRTAASKAYGEAATRPAAHRYTTSPERSRAFWGDMYERLAAAIGVADSNTFADRVYARATRLDAYACVPDAPEVLRELRALGVRVIAASNWEPWLAKLLHHRQLDTLFDAQVISGVIGYEKPDARFFERALKVAGARASQTVHVGDSFEMDVEGALAVGIDAVWLNTAGRPPRDVPTVTRLAEIPVLLRHHVVDAP